MSTPLGDAGSVGVFEVGGAAGDSNVLQDCTFDGTFDGASHYCDDSKYDENASHVRIRRRRFTNIRDDSLDRSRWQTLVVEAYRFDHVGTIVSPAPMRGTVTLRDCQGSDIGGDVRVPDGGSSRPPGLVVKFSGIAATKPQGKLTLERCTFWTDQSSKGVGFDGGGGAKPPMFGARDTTIRTGGIVVDRGYPAATWMDSGCTWSSTSNRPPKTNLPITLTPAADVDARYADPANWRPDRGVCRTRRRGARDAAARPGRRRSRVNADVDARSRRA